MTSGQEDEGFGADLRQGDIFNLIPLGPPGLGVDLDADKGQIVAVISQTCDAIQPNKKFCLVAPVLDTPNGADVAAARNGKKPLLLYLNDGRQDGPWIADLGRAFSVSKTQLSQAKRVARCVDSASSLEARRLGARIGRAYSRFPFPDEVHPVFAGVQDRLREKTGKAGNLSKVLDLVEDIRISANHWEGPERRLRLTVIVLSDFLKPVEDMDPAWSWKQVDGIRSQSRPEELPIDRVCELILRNINIANPNQMNASTVAQLWNEFGLSLKRDLIQPKLNDEVTDVEVQVVSDEEFTYKDYQASESLDLETISDSAGLQVDARSQAGGSVDGGAGAVDG